LNLKDNLKGRLSRGSIVYRTAESVYRSARFLKNILFYKAPSMLDGELRVFAKIYAECKVIFDVGARYDIDYIEISKGNGIKYVLFEINPRFFKKLSDRVAKISGEDIVLENVGIAEENKEMFYYLDSESVLQSTTEVPSSKRNLPLPLPLISLDFYIQQTNIKAVDFLKTDIEEYDYFALVGFSENIKQCKFIQFELGVGAPLGDRQVKTRDYFDLLSKDFNLFLVEDENNPLWRDGRFQCNLIWLDYGSISSIESLQKVGVGFNVMAINKRLKAERLDLKIDGPLRS